MSDNHSFLAAATLAIALGVGVSAYRAADIDAGTDVRTITVVARDGAFDAPDVVPAGLTTIRLEARGTELHHAMLMRLDDDTTLEQALAALAKEELPPGVTLLGGPNPPAPGGAATVSVMLRPGRHAWVCVIPGTDGVPHVVKGMVREFDVVPSTERADAPPAADIALMLNDYSFKVSKPLSAGTHVIRVRNYAAQPHEVVLFRLAPGKTKEDLLAWTAAMNAGPPPAETFGGVAPLSNGQSNDMLVDITPGNYVFVCFVPDVKDGRAHLVHGMVQEFSVR